MAPKRKAKPRTARLAALGKVVEDARLALDLNQKELAAKSGIHPGYASQLEAGLRNPTFEVLSAISDSLELSLSTLMGRVERRLGQKNSK